VLCGVFALFFFTLCLVYSTLPVSLDCPVLIVPSGFLNFNYNNHLHFMCLIQFYYYFRMFRYIISCLLLVIVPVIFSTELVVDKLSSDPIDSRFLYKLLSNEPDLIRKHLLAGGYLRALSKHESEDDMNEFPKRSHMWFRHVANDIPIQTRLSFGQPLSRNGIGSIHKIRYGKK
jgi:hypothetical protein